MRKHTSIQAFQRAVRIGPAFVLALMACVSSGVLADPIYTLQTVIPIPTTTANGQPGGAFTSFDISYFDPVTRLDYVADRSNASVDIISGASLSVVGQARGFTGQAVTTSVSGPDGVVAVTNGGVSTLYAGDGNSTLRIYNVTNPAAPVLLQMIPTGGTFRVDEMAYSPATQQVLVANNADSPAFGTLINTNTAPGSNTIAHSNIVIPGAAASDGLEQPLWDPNTGTFFISVPSFGGGTDPGGVAEIRPDGTVGRLFRFASIAGAPTTCGPAGLALGASGDLMVGCSAAGTQTVLLNPAGNGGNGSIVSLFAQISGSDELWFDPLSGDYFVTGSNTSGGPRVFGVISDATQSFLGSVLLPVAAASNPHSISVDPFNGDVFVPLAGNTSAVGGNTVCPLGCIAVFARAAAVPEPGSLALLAIGILVAGFSARRTRVTRHSAM